MVAIGLSCRVTAKPSRVALRSMESVSGMYKSSTIHGIHPVTRGISVLPEFKNLLVPFEFDIHFIGAVLDSRVYATFWLLRR